MNMPAIPDFLLVKNRGKPMKTVWTFSNLNCYLSVCPHQFYRRYITKDFKFVGSPASKHGDEVHTAMEKRVGEGVKLPEPLARYEPFAAPFDRYERGSYRLRVEEKLAVDANGQVCDFWANDVFFRGKIDLSLVAPDYKAAYILDYKTGSVWDKPLELETSALLLHARHPELKQTKAQYAWLKEERLGKLYDVSHVASTWRTIKNAVAQIESDLTAGHFEKREGPLCGFCSVKDCQFNRSAA